MIHLYHGNGKGKTTAAMGLALRMAGRNRCVVIAQFLKSSDSGERSALALIPQVTLLDIPQSIKFSFQLSPQERLEEQARYQTLLEQLRQAGIPKSAREGCLPCFEHRFEKNGLPFVDIYLQCQPTNDIETLSLI